MTTINVTNNYSYSYQINTQSNPAISLVRGNTYYFVINASGHPFQIRNGNTPLDSSDGVTNNSASNGTITYVVPYNAPNTLSYICTIHSNMGGTINISGLVNPTLSNFSIPTKTFINGGTFIITAPTTNSDGAFSYTSSNTSIATINGNTVTMLAVGTVTITATQAATNNYNSGTITATLTVNAAATLTTPTLSNFSIPTKTFINGGTFIITAPTTNSDGAFSYTSSNTSIATINGNTVTMLAVGTVTITATQAATNNYNSGTTTATLTIKSTICLTNPSIVNIVASDGNKYVFNDSSTYNANIQYGLGIGTYVFKNISIAHPMALLNNGKTNSITYSGDSNKQYTKLVGEGSNGVSYHFYYGDITVQVLSDFEIISIYCYYHGYMGGENLLKYSSSCLIRQPPIFSHISMSSLFTNNAQVFYKPHSLSTGGGGSGVRNSRHKQRRT